MERLQDLLNGIYSATIDDVAVLVREVHVRVGVLPNPVVIRIFFDGRAEEPYRFALSARMRTAPENDARNAPRTAPTEREALRRAVRMLTQDYEDAVRQGLMPDDSWLIEEVRT